VFLEKRGGVFPASVDKQTGGQLEQLHRTQGRGTRGGGDGRANCCASRQRRSAGATFRPAGQGRRSQRNRQPKAIDALRKLEPSPLATKDRVAYIDAANYSQHLEQLRDCDLIIEAIAEKTEWKDDLYRQIAPFIAPDAIIASNTSGLSINRLSEGCRRLCVRASAASISSTRRATCTWSN
jgi:hypothetical protein